MKSNNKNITIMRRVISILAIIAIAISNVSAQANSAMTAAENVYKSMMDLKAEAGIEIGTITELKRNPESGSITSSVEIIPLQCDADAYFSDLIQKVEKAFQTDSPKGYNYGNINTANFGTFKGDDMQSFIEIMNKSAKPAPSLLYLEVKCSDNPQMRTFYGVKWALIDKKVKGTMYLITSKRPDLILSEADKKADDKDEEDVLSSLPQDAQKRIKVLAAMIDTYSDELNDLQKKYYDTGASDVQQAFKEQIKLIVKKRQELLDKMHKIILEETY